MAAWLVLILVRVQVHNLLLLRLGCLSTLGLSVVSQCVVCARIILGIFLIVIQELKFVLTIQSSGAA